MVKSFFEYKGIDQVLLVLDDLIVNFDNDVTDAMKEIADELERLMEKYAPVLTGALRDSIEALRRGKLLVAIRMLYYGFYQEWGTSKMAPRPFIRPAVEELKAKVDKILWKHLGKYFMK